MLAMVFLHNALDHSRRNRVILLKCSLVPHDEKLNGKGIQVSPLPHMGYNSFGPFPHLALNYSFVFEVFQIEADVYYYLAIFLRK